MKSTLLDSKHKDLHQKVLLMILLIYYSAYRIEEDDEEINERKVNNMVKIFVNTFKRNPDLWQSFKNVVDGSSEELPITPIPISSSSKGGKISYANTNRLPNTEDVSI